MESNFFCFLKIARVCYSGYKFLGRVTFATETYSAGTKYARKCSLGTLGFCRPFELVKDGAWGRRISGTSKMNSESKRQFSRAIGPLDTNPAPNIL